MENNGFFSKKSGNSRLNCYIVRTESLSRAKELFFVFSMLDIWCLRYHVYKCTTQFANPMYLNSCSMRRNIMEYSPRTLTRNRIQRVNLLTISNYLQAFHAREVHARNHTKFTNVNQVDLVSKNYLYNKIIRERMKFSKSFRSLSYLNCSSCFLGRKFNYLKKIPSFVNISSSTEFKSCRLAGWLTLTRRIFSDFSKKIERELYLRNISKFW